MLLSRDDPKFKFHPLKSSLNVLIIDPFKPPCIMQLMNALVKKICFLSQKCNLDNITYNAKPERDVLPHQLVAIQLSPLIPQLRLSISYFVCSASTLSSGRCTSYWFVHIPAGWISSINWINARLRCFTMKGSASAPSII